jgi:hypothetical protein
MSLCGAAAAQRHILFSRDQSERSTTFPIFFSRQDTTAMAATELGAPTGRTELAATTHFLALGLAALGLIPFFVSPRAGAQRR